jgi:hypothetical protein
VARRSIPIETMPPSEAASRYDPHLFYAKASSGAEPRPRRAYTPRRTPHPLFLPPNSAPSLRRSRDTLAASKNKECRDRAFIDLMWRSRESLHIKREHQDGYTGTDCQSEFHKVLPYQLSLGRRAHGIFGLK